MKYEATLYALLAVTKKATAQKLGISYGGLRVWHTEDDFRKIIDQHCQQFASMFIKNIRDRIKRRNRLWDDYNTNPLNRFEEDPFPTMDYAEIADYRSYSPLLCLHIAMLLSGKVDEVIARNDYDMTIECFFLIHFMRWGYKKCSKERSKEQKSIEQQMMKMIKESFYEIITERIRKYYLTDDDRRDIIIALRCITSMGGDHEPERLGKVVQKNHRKPFVVQGALYPWSSMD